MRALTALALALALAACSEHRTKIIDPIIDAVLVPDALAEGGGCAHDPGECSSQTQYCDVVDDVCIDICPDGPTLAPFAAATTTDVMWTSETQERTLLGADAAAHGFDDLASDTQPYEVRATLVQGTVPDQQRLVILADESGASQSELAHGATLPAPGTYVVGTDSHWRIVATRDTTSDVYVGFAGTIAITATPSTSSYAGTVTGLELEHIDPTTGALAHDECTVTADTVTWSGAPTQVAN